MSFIAALFSTDKSKEGEANEDGDDNKEDFLLGNNVQNKYFQCSKKICENNRNFLMICLSFCSMKCIIKVIPSHSRESPSVWDKAESISRQNNPL